MMLRKASTSAAATSALASASSSSAMRLPAALPSARALFSTSRASSVIFSEGRNINRSSLVPNARARTLHTTASALDSPSSADSQSAPAAAAGAAKQGLFKSLLHGSESARDEGLTASGTSHSTQVARGKYIHEIVRHAAIPDKVGKYKETIGHFYPLVSSQAHKYKAKLIGSFQVSFS